MIAEIAYFALRCRLRIGLVRCKDPRSKKAGNAKDDIGKIKAPIGAGPAPFRRCGARIVTTLWFVRHAPAVTSGRIAGRRDVPADCTDTAQIAALSRHIAAISGAQIWSSPARRCQQTCAAMNLTPRLIPDLCEQDFGQWEDIPATEIPDLGPLSTRELASYRPPNGECFDQMCARVRPVLETANGPVVIIAHAGTARAALAMVTGPAALSFAIAPLSMTQLTRTPAGWAVECVNRICT